MDIVVTVKQVPEVANVQVDPETGTLIREGISSILNPFCECALDHAVRLKASRPDVRITAVSMGPPQARAALLRALELGADRAVLVTDRKFAGADTWATALTLSETISRCVPDVDLILTGKQAMDGDTAQVGAEISEILNLPQISYASGIQLSESGKKVIVRREIENGWQVIEARLPALVSVSKSDPVRRAPSFAEVLAARSKPFEMVTAADLPLPDEALGLTGSLTQVVKIFPPPAGRCGQVLSPPDPDTAAQAILELLKEKGLLVREMIQ